MQDSFRRFTLTLPLPGSPLAAGNGQVTYVARRPVRVGSAQLSLSDTGTGAGATNVNVNVNGNAINTANGLSIAGGAAGKSVSSDIVTGSEFPGGYRVGIGDTITVDVTSVPAATQPKGGFVTLSCVELDI